VHLIAIDPARPDAALGRIRERLEDLAGEISPRSLHGGGAIDHIAFACDDYEETVKKLRNRRLAYRENYVASLKLKQVFVNDPNGVTLELNFQAHAPEGDAA
jgi:hypothetical protein